MMGSSRTQVTAGNDSRGVSVALAGRRALVVGLGKSGKSAALEILERGGEVLATDFSSSAEVALVARQLEEKGATVILGPQSPQLCEVADLVVVSPGVPWDLPLLERARSKGIPVWSEIELAARLTEAAFLAVTGTNGKTTTVHLLGEMLRAGGFSPLVAGNVGRPLIEAVREAGERPVVVEVSSFQLEGAETFHPKVAVLLNLGEDHTDRHGSFPAYVRAKARIFHNQTGEDWAVLNWDDPEARALAPEIAARIVPFSSRSWPSGGVGIEGGGLVSGLGPTSVLMPLSEIGLRGAHNLENICAASAAALAWGVSPEAIRQAVGSFRALPHRLELVGEVGGVAFYDDSKATNPHATLRAIEAFSEPLILLLGGKNKGLDLSALRGLPPRVRKIVLFGESAEELASVLEGDERAQRCLSLEEAAERAYKLAAKGDVVLLSPACASFDAFKDYAHRGEIFAKALCKIKGS